MLITSRDFINDEMRLRPGDLFRVSVYYETDEFGDEYENTTPDSCEEMSGLSGQWGTVASVEKESFGCFGPDDNFYAGYIHHAVPETLCGTDFAAWKWSWYHMDAVDIRRAPDGPRSGELPDI